MSRYQPNLSSLPVLEDILDRTYGPNSYYGSIRPAAPTLRPVLAPTTAIPPPIPTPAAGASSGLTARNGSNWNMVWLQPRSGSVTFEFNRASSSPAGRLPGSNSRRASMGALEEAGGVRNADDELLMNAEERRRVEQLSRPTLASAMKRETPWMKRYHVLTYMDGDRVAWNKMSLRSDCERCLWNRNGTLRSQTKI